MTDTIEAARLRGNRQNELDTAWLYRTLAEIENGSPLGEVYRRLAATEEQHAAFWEQKMTAAGLPVPPRRPGLRPRIMGILARKFGPQFILPTLAGNERADRKAYDNQPDARAVNMPASEHSHARLLTTIAGGPSAGMAGGALAQLEGRHRAVGGNALRAAVLGANDGLCSNLSLIMGVAGAAPQGHAVLIAGIAGLLAGAGSMAMGEWLSVQSSRELAEKQIAIEADELAAAPQEEESELALIYQAKGLAQSEATTLAHKLMADHDNALDTLVREELGLDPKELGGSAWEAAISSFMLFVVGAIFPVAPFFWLNGNTAVWTSLVVSAVMLFLIGAATTLITGKGVLATGLRQLLIGTAAAGLTFGIGKLIGVAVS